MALLLGGCELETRAVLDLAEDGSGSVAVEVELDDQLLATLDSLEVDPTAELTAAVADDPAWRLERETAGGGLTVRAVREDAEDPAGILRELGAGLTEQDPGLLVDLDIDVDDDGRLEAAGTARLRPSVAPGALDGQGEPFGPDAVELRQLTDEHLRAQLEITMPGRVVGHDADQAEGTTLRWSLSPGDEISVRAASVPQAVPPELLWIGSGVLAVATISTLAVMLRRR